MGFFSLFGHSDLEYKCAYTSNLGLARDGHQKCRNAVSELSTLLRRLKKVQETTLLSVKQDKCFGNLLSLQMGSSYLSGVKHH